jgi:hypothetical protein
MKRFPKRYAEHAMLGKGKFRSQKWWMVFGKLLVENHLVDNASVDQFLLVAPSSSLHSATS